MDVCINTERSFPDLKRLCHAINGLTYRVQIYGSQLAFQPEPCFSSSLGMVETHVLQLNRPWRYVTGARGHGFIAEQAERIGSRLLYEYLARCYPFGEWTTMNYGYAELGSDAHPQNLGLHDTERFALQLYRYVATLGSRRDRLTDLDVIEIGSGRGGGAAYLARTLKPKTFIPLDFSQSATTLARAHHQTDTGPRYVQGDAENLVFEASGFDVAINIESAHCYRSIPRFLAEVYRVLRPGGELLFAGFASRRGGALERLQTELAESSLRLIREEDITANVVQALELDEGRKLDVLQRRVRGPFKTFARGALCDGRYGDAV